MKKKIAGILMTVVLTLTACGNEEMTFTTADPGSYKDGSYTETAKGKNGDFPVTVLIQDGYIADVTIGENKETPDIGGKAITQLPESFIEKQTYQVDTVAGATVTSTAVKSAVGKCLEKASQ